MSLYWGQCCSASMPKTRSSYTIPVALRYVLAAHDGTARTPAGRVLDGGLRRHYPEHYHLEMVRL